MSHISKLRFKKAIQPGVQIVHVISAMRGGNAERVVRAIARHEGNDGSRIRRKFPPEWRDEGGISVLSGSVVFGDAEFPLALKIGIAEGLVLADGKDMHRSMKPVNGRLALAIGDKLIIPGGEMYGESSSRPSNSQNYYHRFRLYFAVCILSYFRRILWGYFSKSLDYRDSTLVDS